MQKYRRALRSSKKVSPKNRKTEAEQQKAAAEEQRGIAVKQSKIAARRKEEADKQRSRAENQTEIAVREEKRAEEQEKVAVTEKKKAEDAKKAEEYEAYIAQIGLANAKINDNAYDYALQLLNASKPELRNWEWGRLEHLCRLGTANYKAAAPVDAVAYSPDGKSFVTGDQDGKVTVRDAQTGDVRFQAPHGQYVLSVAYSPDGKQIAAGSSDKTIQIFDAATGRAIGAPLKGHTDGVLTVRFSPDGGSCSAARTTTRPGCGISPRARRCKNSKATAGGSGRPSFRRTPIESSPPARTARRSCGKSGRRCKSGS